MNVSAILQYSHQKNGVVEDFPFNEDTMVLKVGDKIFLMLSLDQQPLVMAVKTNPEWSVELRARYPQITGAYHMNKTHWNSVVVEGLPKELILKLIDESYQLIWDKMPKKIQQQLSVVVK